MKEAVEAVKTERSEQILLERKAKKPVRKLESRRGRQAQEIVRARESYVDSLATLKCICKTANETQCLYLSLPFLIYWGLIVCLFVC